MPGKKAKWLDNMMHPEDLSTRARSGKQEKRLAKEMEGRTTYNSGATFGQNDIITDKLEIEAKTTRKNSYSLKLADFDKLHKKCSSVKIPVMVVNFEGQEMEFAILKLADLKELL